MTIRYLNPVQPPDIVPAKLAPRLKSMEGITLGLLPNSKTNAKILLDLIVEELAKTATPGRVVSKGKLNASSNCPPDLIDELTDECDAVITGLGD